MQPITPHGNSRRLLSLLGDGLKIEMLGYADGGFGIVRNGIDTGYWTASEHIECVAAFQALGKIEAGEHCIIFSREMFQAVSASMANTIAKSN